MIDILDILIHLYIKRSKQEPTCQLDQRFVKFRVTLERQINDYLGPLNSKVQLGGKKLKSIDSEELMIDHEHQLFILEC